MLRDNQRTAAIIAIVAIIVLEVWRRALRARAPRWVHRVTIALLVATGIATAAGAWAMYRTVERTLEAEGGNKATMLAAGISRAMTFDLVGFGCVIVAVVVLIVGSLQARRTGEAGPGITNP